MLHIRDLHVSYGALHVLRGVSLDIPPGEMFGLLGPNGAGKTTLIHTILGLLKPQRGTVQLFGSADIERNTANIGYLPERQRIHPHVTGREYLTTLGKLSGLRGTPLTQQVTSVLGAMELQEAADRRLGTYSKGMLQRIGLAQAVLHDPDLLIIDEPTSGLDPQGQEEMVALLQRLRVAGHTIIMCTHRLVHVGALCQRVGVLVDGQINDVARVADLQANGHSMVIEVDALPPFAVQALHTWGRQVQPDGTRLTLHPADDVLVATVLRYLLDHGIAVRAMLPQADAIERFYAEAVQTMAAAPAMVNVTDTTTTTDTLVKDS